MDCKARGGGFLFYLNQNLNCKVINNYPMCQYTETMVSEQKLFKTIWLIIGIYKPPSFNDTTFHQKLEIF